ncbi:MULTISPECIES: hypothetical protein [Streptomyces]|uniref:hypothetical protein n=1 Tax=Streptomyces TaxID=1883 RepID=UPI00167611B7|nr:MULTISPECIES: hypothetical protein [Streptomyces]MBD3577218.1 hypothetical protein [Streptomyces sp. KD18]GGS86491.1 hypothetical protein GCM10010286_08940 [Streptomyces toxytricini]
MDDSRTLDEILQDPQGLSEAEVERIRLDRLLGVTAILLSQRGHHEAATLLAEAASAERNYQDKDWGVEFYEVALDVDPSLVERFTEDVHALILETIQEAVERETYGVSVLRIRPILPAVEPNWRANVRADRGTHVSNQARKVRSDPQHPIEDRLHFTNLWEHRVYRTLKAIQATLEDSETIGIAPLAGIRVRDRVFEPDFLITYKGHAGVIEIDGPYHQGQSSSDKSRDRQLLHAGVKYVDRLDVRDVNSETQVEKFLRDFLRMLGS